MKLPSAALMRHHICEGLDAESNVARTAHYGGPGKEAIRMVRLPDATGRLRNAGGIRIMLNIRAIRAVPTIPGRVLRGLFSGVGQLLLAADRFRGSGISPERYGRDDRFDPATGLDGEPPARDGWRPEGDAGSAVRISGGRAGARHRSRAVSAHISGK